MAVKIKLTSYCHAKGAEGQPGDVVTVTDEKLAKKLLDGRAGKKIADVKDEPKKKATAKGQ